MKKENTIILFYILKQTQFSTQVSPDFIQKCTPFSTYYQDENQLPKKMVAILEIKNN
jgi:hypothetical protein